MRKIESQMLQAIKARKSVSLGNTTVQYLEAIDTPMHARIEYAKIFLHGNHIASFTYSHNKFDYNPMTLAQWPTPTTKSRLRAMGIAVYTKQGKTYVGERLIA